MKREELKHLRPDGTAYPRALDPGLLDTFDNPAPERSYRIRFETAEVTSLCPVTDQPDFYRVTVDYVPNRRCLESKSLKLYFVSFRNAGLFAESMANRILDELGIHRATFCTLPADPARDADHIFLLRHTLMNPWLTATSENGNYVDMYWDYLDELIDQALGK